MESSEYTIFQTILHSGNAKSLALEAVQAAKVKNFMKARELLRDAGDALNNAHAIQTSLIQSEIRGEKVELSLLMIHAQDHVMNAITTRDLAREIVEIYETLGGGTQ